MQKRRERTLGRAEDGFNTYSHLDAQLPLRLLQGLPHRIHMRVHVHCDSFDRRHKLCVCLRASLEGSKGGQCSWKEGAR